MGLAEVVSAAPTPRRTGNPCSVGVLLEQITDEDRDILLELLYGPARCRGNWGSRSAPEIYKLLVKAGYTVSQQQINRHRSGQCRCEGEA